MSKEWLENRLIVPIERTLSGMRRASRSRFNSSLMEERVQRNDWQQVTLARLAWVSGVVTACTLVSGLLNNMFWESEYGLLDLVVLVLGLMIVGLGAWITAHVRRRMEISLFESEQRYRTLVEHTPTGVLLVGERGRILDVNDRLVEILGSPSREATMAISVFDFPPLVEAGIADHFRQCMIDRERNQHEGWYTSKWGRRVYWQYYLSPIQIAGETCVLAHVVDLTTSKELEAQVYQAQKMDALGRMAAGIAHDFNNYLTALGGYVYLLKSSTNLTDEEIEDVEKIEAVTTEARAMIGQLMSFGRKSTPTPETVYLNDVIADLEPVLPRLSGDSRVIVSNVGKVGPVSIDRMQVGRILLNLVANARDAGATQISIRASHIEQGESRAVRLSVHDDGAGMSQDVLDHLFEPFFTTKEEGKGTGLGLFTVYRIVQQAGGHIQVHSALGQGTTFEIDFPIGEGNDNSSDCR